MATGESFAGAPNGEPRTLIVLLLEAIALRHQIAVLKRSRTRRPCFRLCVTPYPLLVPVALLGLLLLV